MSTIQQEKIFGLFEDYLEGLSWKDLGEKWKKICLEEKQIQEKKEEIKQEMLKKANNQNICEDGVFVKKVIRKGNIDYKKIPELSMIDLEQYRKDPSEFWEIKVLEN